MRALSVHQPHGSLLITGAKPFETRNRLTHVRGEILLHASQHCSKTLVQQYLDDPYYKAGLQPLVGGKLMFPILPVTIDDLAFGAFIGIGELVNCFRCEDLTEAQRAESRSFGDFSKGMFAWEFRNIRRFKTPILGKARQGFFFAAVDLRGNELIPVTQLAA